jgi:hypothetical protein
MYYFISLGCSTSIPAWIIAVPIVIGLLILGIILIVIAKLILLLLDRYEYKQFKKEVANSKFGAVRYVCLVFLPRN